VPDRDRADRCPGVLRPWIADDGALVRLRVPGGELPTATLSRLLEIAAEFGDGRVQLTRRANLQVRAIDHVDGCVPQAFVDAIDAAGLLPHPPHELVRNIMVSPLTGRAGGRADLRPVARALDVELTADPEFAALPGRFLFVLDDGRGDVGGRSLDLGAFVVDEESAQLRLGTHLWGPVVPLEEIAPSLALFAARFIKVRGEGERAAWHVDELPDDIHLGANHGQDLRTHVTSLPLPHGRIAQDDDHDAEHVAIPDGLLTKDLADDVLGRAGDSVIVTPWRSLILPDLEPR
jgi:precorrin-3B synthase